MLTAIVMASLMTAGLVFLGGTVLYLFVVVVLKLAWLGVSLLLHAGTWIFLLVLGLVALVLKLTGLLLVAAVVAAGLLACWFIGTLFFGKRRPAEAEFCRTDYRLRSAGGWHVRRDAVHRLNRWVDRLESRIDDLERNRA